MGISLYTAKVASGVAAAAVAVAVAGCETRQRGERAVTEGVNAVFSPDGKQLTETAPVIVDGTTFASYLSEGPVLFIGDGAGKCGEALAGPDTHFVQVCPRAAAMLVPALREFEAGNFRDVAYFEPFYLKDFVATVSRKKLF